MAIIIVFILAGNLAIVFVFNLGSRSAAVLSIAVKVILRNWRTSSVGWLSHAVVLRSRRGAASMTAIVSIFFTGGLRLTISSILAVPLILAVSAVSLGNSSTHGSGSNSCGAVGLIGTVAITARCVIVTVSLINGRVCILRLVTVTQVAAWIALGLAVGAQLG